MCHGPSALPPEHANHCTDSRPAPLLDIPSANPVPGGNVLSSITLSINVAGQKISTDQAQAAVVRNTGCSAAESHLKSQS
jgi:hypothetical protein